MSSEQSRVRAPRKTAPHPKGVLRRSASRFSRMALRDYLASDWPAFFVHAGTGLEQLAKAYLASFHPSLIADSKSFDALLHSCGRGAHARTPREAMRTITASEALNRCGQILPAVANMRADLDVLVQSRNGAVHIGEASERFAERSLLAFLRASRQLIGEGGWDEGAFWGKFASFVGTRLSESANAARIRVATLVAKAQVDFDQRFGRLDPETRRTLLDTIVSTYVKRNDDDQFVECPACHTDTLAGGTLEVEWSDESGNQLMMEEPYPEVTFFPGHLDCRVCGLVLDGEEEIQASTVPESIELVDFDSDELYRDRFWDDAYP